MLIKSFLLEGNEDLVHKTEWWRKKNLPFYEMKRKHSFLGIKFIQEKSSNLRWAKKKRLNLKFIEKVSLSSKVPSLTKKFGNEINACILKPLQRVVLLFEKQGEQDSVSKAPIHNFVPSLKMLCRKWFRARILKSSK